jgi:CheY-like chemotaxis protein
MSELAASDRMRVLIVEDEPLMAEAIRDGLRIEAIAADIAGDGDGAPELLSVNAYDIAVLDRDIPGPSGDETARRSVASGIGMGILMLTTADRLGDKASGFELGADDYVTKPFELLKRAWDEHANPCTNAVRITVSALRKTPRRTLDHRHSARRRLPHRHSARHRARTSGPWIERPISGCPASPSPG